MTALLPSLERQMVMLGSKSSRGSDLKSRVVEQLAAEIYTRPGTILREIVTNAHDSYLSLESEHLEKKKLERAVVISRRRHASGAGRLIIEDNGMGASFGFGEVIAWAGAGSKVTIESSTKGVASRHRLEINVRRIYEKMRIDTTEGDIQNDPECISLSRERCGKDDHGTTVEIECDGKGEIVNSYELNRVYPLTDLADDTLERILVEACPIPYAQEGGVCKSVHAVYDRCGYIPTAVYLDGKSLERRLPFHLTDFQVQDIKVAGRVAAVAWCVEDPKRAGSVGVDARGHLVGGPGIQIVKHNVPIGPRNIFSDIAGARFLTWFVGEVHIISDDLQPDAAGLDFRQGLFRDAFIKELRKFYNALCDRAEAKSRRLKA